VEMREQAMWKSAARAFQAEGKPSTKVHVGCHKQ
jgi:hypothetical protein